MKLNRIRVLVTGVFTLAIGFYAETAFSGSNNNPVTIAVAKGTKWLVSVQGKDGAGARMVAKHPTFAKENASNRMGMTSPTPRLRRKRYCTVDRNIANSCKGPSNLFFSVRNRAPMKGSR